MRLEQHPVAQNAVNVQRVLGVGGIFSWVFDPLGAPFADVFTGTVQRLDDGAAAGGTSTTAGQPVVKQTFAGAFGGALGQTAGKVLVFALIAGGAWWLFNRHRPKVL